ncbi:MAG: hypothetical protein Edafosvirus5_51 [Edafosvirus sp.]|uniref:Ankyrin repeat protein n=1 Tax=Edafosvirus sp. TaxID=2487765 RepID=A0A3G4ZX18_9VIRU|nr:MAG: hypothetical protein Edafosvirus5_51 [Edafosvirus sp.]
MGNATDKFRTEEEALNILEENKNINWDSKNVDGNGNTYLTYACLMKYGKLACKVIDKYIELEKKEERIRDPKIKIKKYANLLGYSNRYGYDALYIACQNYLVNVIIKLLEQKMEYLDNTDNPNPTMHPAKPFVISMTNDDTDKKIMMTLLYYKSCDGDLLIDYVMESPNVNIEMILEIIKVIDINCINLSKYDQITFMMGLIQRFGKSVTISSILENTDIIKKYNWHIGDQGGRLPINYAVMYGNITTFKQIYNIYKSMPIKYIETPFKTACKMKNIEIAEYILSDDYKMSEDEQTLILQNPELTALRKYIKITDIDQFTRIIVPQIFSHIDTRYLALCGLISKLDTKLSGLETKVNKIDNAVCNLRCSR